MTDPSRDRQALVQEPPVGERSDYSRKTWQPAMIGRLCYAALVSGESCSGLFRGAQP